MKDAGSQKCVRVSYPDRLDEAFQSTGPPEAITGIETRRLTSCNSSTSKPRDVPSRSNEVSRISPAPRCSASSAH